MAKDLDPIKLSAYFQAAQSTASAVLEGLQTIKEKPDSTFDYKVRSDPKNGTIKICTNISYPLHGIGADAGHGFVTIDFGKGRLGSLDPKVATRIAINGRGERSVNASTDPSAVKNIVDTILTLATNRSLAPFPR